MCRCTVILFLYGKQGAGPGPIRCCAVDDHASPAHDPMCAISYLIFTNFAFEVQLVIVQGDWGGIVFRDDARGNFLTKRYDVPFAHD